MQTYDMTTMLALDKVQATDVVWVYSGKANACACGCKGNYRYAAAHQAQGAERRGYAVAASEVNDRQVTKILRTLRANPTLVEHVAAGHFAADINGRLFMLATTEAK